MVVRQVVGCSECLAEHSYHAQVSLFLTCVEVLVQSRNTFVRECDRLMLCTDSSIVDSAVILWMAQSAESDYEYSLTL